MEALCPYTVDVEDKMRRLYSMLNERDRRRYAAVEAAKLGYGGVSYVSRVFDCDPKTIERGACDLENPPELPPGRIRKKGGTQVLSC